MAKNARKKTSKAKKTKKTKKTKRPKARRAAKPVARAKASRNKASRNKARKRTRKSGSAFQIMIDTINQTERMREKRQLRGSDESE
jgi:hypothetical protein